MSTASPFPQLPRGAQQLACKQFVTEADWRRQPGFREKLRGHMLAELARTAAEEEVQLLHQPVEEVVPAVAYPSPGVLEVRLFAWTAPHFLRMEWWCMEPHLGEPCTPAAHQAHDPRHLCGWRLARVVK